MDDQRGLSDAPDGVDNEVEKKLVPLRSRQGLVVSWAAIIISMIVMSACRFAEPYCRTFSWEDATIGHHYISTEFPLWTLIIAGLVPIVLVATFAAQIPIFPGSWLWEMHEAVMCVMLAYALAVSVLIPSKLYAGRLRPNFLEKLKDLGYQQPLPSIHQNGTTSAPVDYCGITDLFDSRQSFPSGYTTICFTAATLVTLFIGNRLRVLAQPSQGFIRLFYFFLSMTPLPFAGMVAISRTKSNSSHFTDVVAGVALGMGSALLAFRLQYSFCKKRKCFVPTTLVPPPLPPAVIYEGLNDQVGDLPASDDIPPRRDVVVDFQYAA